MELGGIRQLLLGEALARRGAWSSRARASSSCACVEVCSVVSRWPIQYLVTTSTIA
jgi:hypothetical protein